MSPASYDAYKPSGIDVIGAIPAHWEARSLCQLGRLLKGVGGSKDDVVAEGVPCVRYGDLYTTHAEVIEEARTFLTQDRATAYTPIRYGDVLFAASGEKIEEIGKSAVNLIPGEARCGGDLVILRPSVPTVPRFFGYAADASPSVAQKASMGRGTTVKHIYPDELRRLKVAIPPIPEQEAIADFLDRKTAAIDALIAKKERLIGLLQEKRQALITQAVTKGLDPNVPMKDSGIEWLGEIPAHWRVLKLKQASRRVVVGIAEAATHAYTDAADGVPIVRSVNVRPNDLDTSNLLSVERWFAERNRSKYVRAGDLLTQRTGEYSGTTAVVPVALDMCQCFTMVITTPGPELLSDFASLFIGSAAGWEYFEQVRWGSAQPNISVPIMANTPIVLPPISEQRAILERVRAQGELGAELLRTQIAKLREYRQALISAAVTGKIDVTKERAA